MKEEHMNSGGGERVRQDHECDVLIEGTEVMKKGEVKERRTE